MERTFTIQQAAALLSASERTILRWTGEAKIVEPLLNPGRRRTPKVLSFENLVQLAVAQQLAQHKVSLHIIRDLVGRIPRGALPSSSDPDYVRLLAYATRPGDKKPLAASLTAYGSENAGIGNSLAEYSEQYEVLIVVNLNQVVKRLEKLV